MKIGILGGRFHPPHRGHVNAYSRLSKLVDIAYIATSDKQGENSPFSFDEKKQLFTDLGIPSGHIVQTRTPYSPVEIMSQHDIDADYVIFGVSEKDNSRFTFKPKKDGSPSYMQPYTGKGMKPAREHGYVIYLPVSDIVYENYALTSATEFRKMYNEDQQFRTIVDHEDYSSKESQEILINRLLT